MERMSNIWQQHSGSRLSNFDLRRQPIFASCSALSTDLATAKITSKFQIPNTNWTAPPLATQQMYCNTCLSSTVAHVMPRFLPQCQLPKLDTIKPRPIKLVWTTHNSAMSLTTLKQNSQTFDPQTPVPSKLKCFRACQLP